MSKATNETIRKAINLIEELIQNGKTVRYIKWRIHDMLIDSQVNISDIDHFDRYYFKPTTGKRIATYVREAKFDYACLKYESKEKKLRLKETYYDVSQFKKKYEQKRGGTKVKKYMVTDLWLIEEDELNHKSYLENNDDFILIEAENKEAAIKKYLGVVMEFTPQYVIKEDLFKYMWDCSAYGDMKGFEGFENEDKILELSEKVWSDYLGEGELDPDKMFLEHDTIMLAEEFWKYLSEEERFETFIMSNYTEVFCIELMSLAKLKKHKKSLIYKAEPQDLKILNIIADNIRKETKEKYILNLNSFLDSGCSKKEAEELVCRIKTYRFKYMLKHQTETCYLAVNLIKLIEIVSTEGKETIAIEPHELLKRLAEEGYNFNNAKNQKVKGIIEDWMKTN